MVLGDDEKISIQVFEDVARHLAVVTISDSGKGLNQEEIDEINQPFDYDWEYWKNENRGIDCATSRLCWNHFMMDRRVCL